MKTVTEPARTLPVAGAVEVAVVGAGIAGVAAALAAARAGAHVAVLDKACLPGGLATLGNVIVYLPLCDGYGHQVSAGIAEELLRLSVRHRPDAIPEPWRGPASPEARAGARWRVDFNPWDFALDLEAALVAAGVDIWYDTRVCAVRRDGPRLTHLVVENKSGRQALAAAAVVDASGDADVCALAGAPTVSLATNVRAGWWFAWDGERVRLVPQSQHFDEAGGPVPGDPALERGDDGAGVTRHLLGTRELQRRRLAELRAAHPGAEPLNLNTLPDLRMTRRLDAAVTLTGADVGRDYPDLVGMFADWRRRGPVYPLPYRCLVAPGLANLAAAGRCLASAGIAWDQARAIPACAVSGQAAGLAAAMVAQGAAPSLADLPVADLRAALAAAGVQLDPACLARARERQAAADPTARPDLH